MSRTYLALEQALNRRVVVKVLAPELLAGISVERFQREVLLAAQLQHPHVVPVLTAGDAGGVPWFSMPYVDGDSLRQRLERGPVAHRRGDQHPPRRGPGPGVRARAWHRPPRHQARQRPALRRQRHRHRLRHRQGHHRRPHRRRRPAGHPDAGRHLDRHAGLHGARAGRGGPERRPSGRPLRVRGHGVRADRRPAAVPGQHAGATPGGAHERDAARPPIDPPRHSARRWPT